MAINIIERAITPYNSPRNKIDNKGEYSLYAPAAGINKPGMAGFDPTHFSIREQIVSLSAPLILKLEAIKDKAFALCFSDHQEMITELSKEKNPENFKYQIGQPIFTVDPYVPNLFICDIYTDTWGFGFNGAWTDNPHDSLDQEMFSKGNIGLVGHYMLLAIEPTGMIKEQMGGIEANINDIKLDINDIKSDIDDIEAEMRDVDNTPTRGSNNLITSDAVAEVLSIAKGATQAKGFDNYTEMIAALEVDTDRYSLQYMMGQNLLIVENDVPDVWICGINEEYYSATESERASDYIKNMLTYVGKVQFGYYTLAALEAKMNLAEYATSALVASLLNSHNENPSAHSSLQMDIAGLRGRIDQEIGNIDTALDGIIAIQNTLIGGDAE